MACFRDSKFATDQSLRVRTQIQKWPTSEAVENLRDERGVQSERIGLVLLAPVAVDPRLGNVLRCALSSK